MSWASFSAIASREREGRVAVSEFLKRESWFERRDGDWVFSGTYRLLLEAGLEEV